MGNDPPQFSIFKHRRRSYATCQTTLEDGAINDTCMVLVGSIAVFTACPRVVTLTALQTAGAFVCAHDYRAVRTVQAAQPL